MAEARAKRADLTAFKYPPTDLRRKTYMMQALRGARLRAQFIRGAFGGRDGGRCRHAPAVTAGVLGLIDRRVGGFQKLLDALGAGSQRDADADRRLQIVAAMTAGGRAHLCAN